MDALKDAGRQAREIISPSLIKTLPSDVNWNDCLYVKYSTRGHVERQIQHKAKKQNNNKLHMYYMGIA